MEHAGLAPLGGCSIVNGEDIGWEFLGGPRDKLGFGHILTGSGKLGASLSYRDWSWFTMEGLGTIA